MPWEDVYPILTEQHLADYRSEASEKEKQELAFHFQVQEVVNPRPSKKIIATSLFWKPDNKDQNSYPTPSLAVLRDPAKYGIKTRYNPWQHYIKPLLAGARHLRESIPDTTLRVYLANDLAFLLPLLTKAGCEIHLMASSSLLHSPGAIWRFLALEEDAEVTIIDSDRALYAQRDADRTTLLKQSSLKFWRLSNPYHLHPENYLNIPALQFGGLGNLSVRETACAFLWHQSKSQLWVVKNPINQKAVSHQLATWPLYCFDEWFMQVALFPQMVREGVLTLVDPNFMPLFHWFALEMEYCQRQNPHSEILLVPQPRGKNKEPTKSDSPPPSSSPI